MGKSSSKEVEHTTEGNLDTISILTAHISGEETEAMLVALCPRCFSVLNG